MSKHPEILDVKTVAKTRLFEIESVDLQFSNGEQRTFERLARRNNGAVMIVPITAEQEFILIREYAVGFDEYELSFPKGFIEPGEPTEEAANRELKEEIGFGAKKIQLLKSIGGSPAYQKSRFHIVVAQDLYPEKLEGDEPEPLEIVKWPINDYNKLLAQTDFCSAMSVAALLLTKEKLNLD